MAPHTRRPEAPAQAPLKAATAGGEAEVRGAGREAEGIGKGGEADGILRGGGDGGEGRRTFAYVLCGASPFAPAAPHISPNPRGCAVEEYLVGTCGLTRPQALEASKKLSHLKSPANSDAVLAFLSGLGLSGADAAAVVAKDPLLLRTKVDKTLAPRVAELTGLGFSRPDIARLVSLTPDRFRCRNIVSRLHYYLHLLGSFHSFLRLLKRSSHLLSSDLDKFDFSSFCRVMTKIMG
uniref:Uncharacterized protein n=1 Tax=Aegilops tauschii TaxID=37682 RepID=M8B1L9_AEGTA